MSLPEPMNVSVDEPCTVLLGLAQDGGYPHAGCERSCCVEAREDTTRRHDVACLGICDPRSGEAWMVDATPDFATQLTRLLALGRFRDRFGGAGGREVVGEGGPGQRGAPVPRLAGILLTHAHIGHYLGLAQLGREVMGASRMPLYVMPRMERFLRENGPWAQLFELGNVEARSLSDGVEVGLGAGLSVTPMVVPHRGEYSETVAFRIMGARRSVLYLPDIDDWASWPQPLVECVRDVDVAYIDGTFFDDGELPRRNAAEVPHPRVRHTMDLLQGLPAEDRAKVRFVHLNHTNPLILAGSPEKDEVARRGYGIATEGEVVAL